MSRDVTDGPGGEAALAPVRVIVDEPRRDLGGDGGRETLEHLGAALGRQLVQHRRAACTQPPWDFVMWLDCCGLVFCRHVLTITVFKMG